VSFDDHLVYSLQPLYLALDATVFQDTSDSFGDVLNSLAALIDELDKNAAVADMVRLEVILFADSADTVVPLGSVTDAAHWLNGLGAAPVSLPGAHTDFGTLFSFLRTRIERGMVQIGDSSYQGTPFRSFRPIVLLIGDGVTCDDPTARSRAFGALTAPSFPPRPDIVCIGVGSARTEALAPYAAGRFGCDRYTVGNRAQVLIPGDGADLSRIARTFAAALIGRLFSPCNCGASLCEQDLPSPAESLSLFWGAFLAELSEEEPSGDDG